MIANFNLRLSIALTAGALTLCAGEAWKTKASSQWSDDDVHKILTDSPWAKQTKVVLDGFGGDRRSGGGGGGGRGQSGGGAMGRIPIGIGGIGFPGGGGRSRGGMGGPGGGQRRPPGGAGATTTKAIVRWESALPIQQALARQSGNTTPEAPPASDKDYIISIVGVNLPATRRDSTGDDDRTQTDTATDDRRERLMSSTRLVRQDGTVIHPEDVKFDSQSGTDVIRFYFPRKEAISGKEKEVIFRSQSRTIRLEQKFHPKEMKFQSQVTL